MLMLLRSHLISIVIPRKRGCQVSRYVGSGFVVTCHLIYTFPSNPLTVLAITLEWGELERERERESSLHQRQHFDGIMQVVSGNEWRDPREVKLVPAKTVDCSRL